MSNSQLHTAISYPRFSRYLFACNNSKQRALKLYRENIKLSAAMYRVIGIFEIILRNSIDRHMTSMHGEEWLLKAVQTGGYLEKTRWYGHWFNAVQQAIKSLGRGYSHDKLITKLTFGFWTYQFANKQFIASGTTLLNIFANRPFNTSQKDVFRLLDTIRHLRNRIAHYEPICFDGHQISLKPAQNTYNIILMLLHWLGCHPNKIIYGIDGVPGHLKTLTHVKMASFIIINPSIVTNPHFPALIIKLLQMKSAGNNLMFKFVAPLKCRPMSMVDSFEKIPVNIFANIKEGSRFVAQEIAALIRQKQSRNEKCILGLATGSTPKTLYAELIRMHREEGLSFKNVIAFNLDEYYPIDKDALQSYDRFMKVNLFNHIDIDPANCFIPNGELPKEQIKQHCIEYEQKIEAAGGIDLQILGIGNNGHIGFNEPGSSIHSKTRLIPLENSTRVANAYEFQHISQVPRLALTVGISTILKSKRIILMAWGLHKAPVVQKSVEANVTEQIPASLLQQHPDCLFVLDEQGASELTRIKSPWLTGEISWTPAMVKRAVVNMALKLGKPILSLTNNDYNESGLADLLVEKGDAYEINLEVYYMLRDSITGWPGGKPNAVLPNHPERSLPYPKKVIIFSPHPDDDIISMGGTFQRLHDQGHDVHVAYQTSGNIAVTDEFVTRFLDFAVGFEEISGIDTKKSSKILADAKAFLEHKKSNQVDTSEIRAIKGLIRRCEAKATCRYVGLKEENCHFLNLPFYETGAIEKKPMGEEDIIITMQLLRELKPQQVYCAGDLADPHGTHKICLDIVFESLRRLKAAGDEWINDCWVWLYKGAWQEWNIEEIEMAIPMSPDQVLKKRFGIFIHQSQKDMVPFQGTDTREFWQRAEDRNAETARQYAKLGLTQYAAMEAFVRWTSW